MNSFYERFFVHTFCYVLPLLRLHGAEHDACSAHWCHQSSRGKCSDLLVQCMSSSPLIRARFTEAMDRASLPAVRKTKVQAIHTYAEALFPYLIGLLLELGAPRSGLCVLYEYITRRGDVYTARTGLPFPRPIATRDQLDATWKTLTGPLALSPPVECADPRPWVAVGLYGHGNNTCNPG